MCIKLSKTYPFVVFTPESREGGSEHVPLGASVCQRPPTENVERFLSMLRFDSREKVNALGRYADPETIK
jgi:hypothetical protein